MNSHAMASSVVSAALAALVDLDVLPPCDYSLELVTHTLTEPRLRTPLIGCRPPATDSLHLGMLLDFDSSVAQTLPSDRVEVLWMESNIKQDAAGICHGGTILRSYVPATSNCNPHRVVLICCEQIRPISLAAMKEVWGASSGGTTRSAGHISPAAFVHEHGLRAVGMHCEVLGDTSGTMIESDATWLQRWRRGGRFLKWLLLGLPMAGWPQFADANAELDQEGFSSPISKVVAVEFAVLATAWEMATQLRAMAASKNCVARSALVQRLQALLEATQKGDQAEMRRIEAHFAELLPSRADEFFASLNEGNVPPRQL